LDADFADFSRISQKISVNLRKISDISVPFSLAWQLLFAGNGIGVWVGDG